MFGFSVLIRWTINWGREICYLAVPWFVVIGYANAIETQCVRLNAEAVCATSDNCYDTSDCAVDCDGVPVELIGRCSDKSGIADSSVSEDISVSANSSENMYCWCAMVKPYPSKWVFRYKYESVGYGCAKNCARGCRNAMIFDGDSDIEFRRVIYRSMLGK